MRLRVAGDVLPPLFSSGACGWWTKKWGSVNLSVGKNTEDKEYWATRKKGTMQIISSITTKPLTYPPIAFLASIYSCFFSINHVVKKPFFKRETLKESIIFYLILLLVILFFIFMVVLFFYNYPWLR